MTKEQRIEAAQKRIAELRKLIDEWTKKMKVLVACEYSGIVRDAFAAKGNDAWSCDILDTESKGQHIKGDVL